MYASIEEAYGGVSGNSLLNVNMTNTVHPQHKKTIERFSNTGVAGNMNKLYGNGNNEYKCTYRNMPCEEVLNNNMEYNNRQKMVADGTQNFTQMSPNPQNYTFSPQYPWYPWAKEGYLKLPNQVSSMFYNNPYDYYPEIAKQISKYQAEHPNNYEVKIERPFRENFNGGNNNCDNMDNLIKKCMIMFIFYILFLIVLFIFIILIIKFSK